jgi:hypothetical protein
VVATSRPARPALVSAYHVEVDAAVTNMSAILSAGAGNAEAVDALDRTLRGPAARRVIDRTPDSRADLLAAARRELEDPKMQLPSSPKSRAALVRILVLHQVDAMWWSHVPPYADQAAVDAAPELVSLPRLEQAGALRFRFAVQPAGLLGRGRDAAQRRFTPRRRPQVSGMKFLVARPEIVTLLNEVADLLRKEAPTDTPPLWVNSIVRSVEHQQHLSALGYSALLPSSHCLGWAADVEMTWFETFGAAETLQAILTDYRDRGVLNVIGEGQAWHLCLSPDHVAAYRDPSLTADLAS